MQEKEKVAKDRVPNQDYQEVIKVKVKQGSDRKEAATNAEETTM